MPHRVERVITASDATMLVTEGSQALHDILDLSTIARLGIVELSVDRRMRSAILDTQ